MRLTLGIFAAAPAILLFTADTGVRAPAQESGVWRSDWEKARVEAKQSSKPLFVVFR